MGDTVGVVFAPSGRRGVVPVETTVLDAARALGVDLDSVCAGRGICGRCQVAVGASVETPAVAGQLTDPGTMELDYRGRRPLLDGNRLGCAARIQTDVVIDVPPESRVHRQVVRKRAEVVDMAIDPVVRLHYVDVEAAGLERQAGDLELLGEALSREWDLDGLGADHHVLVELQDALAAGENSVTVAVHDGTTITGIWPGFHDRALGVAFDVGSTTIAGHLADLASGEVLASTGVMNPQIRFGEDLMSRVSYVMMNDDGAEQLTSTVRQALDTLVGDLVDEIQADRSDVLEIAVVGNPIMHHLFLGIDPRPLGVAPFALTTDASVRLPVRQVGIVAHPGARLYVLPCIAGHVGADAAAAILSEGPHRSDRVQLLVDVGTNAEIVLGSNARLLAASSPTGPAFEGAEISCGQRAAPGAIERVRIDRDSFEARYRVIGVEEWSDDGGFEDAVADLGVTGICGSGIIEVIAEMALAGIIGSDGRVVETHPAVEGEGRSVAYVVRDAEPRVIVTQNDVRAVQLAKAALHAGVRLLMDHLGVETLDEIRLAGAFGSHIDPTYAMVLGMIPDCLVDNVSAAGNAAGTGALMALLSKESRTEIESVVRTVDKIETAIESRFQEQFVEAMAIPHATAEYPRLAESIDLSSIRAPAPVAGRRPRRRPAGTGARDE